MSRGAHKPFASRCPTIAGTRATVVAVGSRASATSLCIRDRLPCPRVMRMPVEEHATSSSSAVSLSSWLGHSASTGSTRSEIEGWLIGDKTTAERHSVTTAYRASGIACVDRIVISMEGCRSLPNWFSTQRHNRQFGVAKPLKTIGRPGNRHIGPKAGFAILVRKPLTTCRG